MMTKSGSRGGCTGMSPGTRPDSFSCVSFARSLPLIVAIMFAAHGSADGQGLSLNAGLGFEYYDAPALSQFLNQNAPGSITPGTYTSAGQFIFGAEHAVWDDWSLGVELGYMIKSASGSSLGASEQIDYSYLSPSVTIRKVVRGEGYYIKYGGAIGYHFGFLGISNPYSSQASNYSAHGLGIRIDAMLDTKLGENLYARVDGEARSEFVGYLRGSDGSLLTYEDTNRNLHPVNMNLSGVGITFGLVYYF